MIWRSTSSKGADSVRSSVPANIYPPDTRADELLLGCALALVLTSISVGFRLHVGLRAGVRRGRPLAGLALLMAVFTLKEPTTPGAWFVVF